MSKNKVALNKETFWKWLGGQNVFLVFAAISIIFFGSSRAYAVLSQDENKVAREELLRVAITPKPVFEASDYAVEKIVTVTITPSATPTLALTATPTTDPDPLIECTLAKSCGGNIVKMKRSECRNSVCCPVEPNKFESLSDDECAKRQSEYNKKQNDEYQKKLKDYEQYLKDFYASKAQENTDIQKQINETNQKLLEMCRENARKMYPEWPSGESPEHRNQRIAELNRCFNIYGQ